MIKRRALIKLIRSSIIIALIPILVIAIVTNAMSSKLAEQEEHLYELTNGSITSFFSYAINTAVNTSYIISKNQTIRDYGQ